MFRLDWSDRRRNLGYSLHFPGGTGATQAQDQAQKTTSFSYFSSLQAHQALLFILFIFFYQTELFIFNTAFASDLGDAGAVLGETFFAVSLFYFGLGAKAQLSNLF